MPPPSRPRVPATRPSSGKRSSVVSMGNSCCGGRSECGKWRTWERRWRDCYSMWLRQSNSDEYESGSHRHTMYSNEHMRYRMAESVHPLYESHRGALEAAMRQRLDLAEPMLRERAHLTDIAAIRREVMDEFEVVLTQMPYVGGAENRMSDFFMRLLGFQAIGRVLHRH